MKEKIIKTGRGEFLLSEDVLDEADGTSVDIVSVFFRADPSQEWEPWDMASDFESAETAVMREDTERIHS